MTAARITLVLGGARSGKSRFAEQLAAAGTRVCFVATATAGDENMSHRIARHRADRPETWTTIEAPTALAETLRPVVSGFDTIVIDCLTMWASNILLAASDAGAAEAAAEAETAALVALMRDGGAHWILVSNEVGLGVVPATTLGRDYRDLLGRVNQRVAAAADRVAFLIAGIPLELRPWSPE